MNRYYPYLMALLALVLSAAVYLWSPVPPRTGKPLPRAGMQSRPESGETRASWLTGRQAANSHGTTEIQAKTIPKSKSKEKSKPPADPRGRRRLASRGSTYRAEVYLLARAIYGEARGEPYIGQVAVGAVILNRIDDPLFPKTIAGVVYEPGAFSAVSDGQINAAPNTEALRAAEDAVNGWDPSGGALYYYNPEKASSAWIWQRPVIKVIGRHVFAR